LPGGAKASSPRGVSRAEPALAAAPGPLFSRVRWGRLPRLPRAARHRDQEIDMTEPSLAEETPAEPDPESTSWMRRLAADDSAFEDEDEDDVDAGQGPSLASGTLLTLGVLWLAAMMWSAHAELAGATDASVILSSAALSLPAIVAACLLAGAGAGLAAAGRYGGGSTARRAGAGAAAGAVCGLLAAGAVLLTYGGGWSIGALAITIGLAGVVGGAAAAMPLPALAAGVAAALGVFATGVVVRLFEPQLTTLLGAGDSVPSRFEARERYVWLAAFLYGLVAGGIAYLFLRRRGSDLRWPAYLMAGAFAGALLLTGEMLTRVGGGRLLGLVSQISDDDRASLVYASGARINTGLIVLFVGAITAMIAFGRTMRRPEA
jgi:hypothetical protein